MRKPKETKLPKETRPKARSEGEALDDASGLPPPEETDALRAAREARSEAFKALGDPIRLAICDYLAVCAPQKQTAGAVCRAVTGDKKITAKVSHHLKELRRAGLIAMHKDGKNVLCGLNPQGTAAALASYLSAWSNGGGANAETQVWIAQDDTSETSDDEKTTKGDENYDRTTNTLDTPADRKRTRRANAA